MSGRTIELGALTRAGRRAAAGARPCRVAVLGDSATQHFAQALTGALAERGFAPAIKEADFDSIEVNALDAASPVFDPVPAYTIVFRSLPRLRELFQRRPVDARPGFARELVDAWRAVWRAIVARTGGAVVVNNFPIPPDRSFGSYALQVRASFPAFVDELNADLVRAVAEEPGVLLCDHRYLAAYLGGQDWLEPKWWFHGRYGAAPSVLPHIAHAVADIIGAREGRTIKCVAFDLDDLVWGGVVGDAGVEGLVLGGSGVGDAYLAMQERLLELQRRGILLAVCSKNDDAVAKSAFRSVPGMALKEEDVAVFVANWGNKADNLRDIAQRLNIGPDAILFLDDSPFERELVRGLLPEVTVPELPEDPADRVVALDEGNFFETLTFSQEDAARTSMYRQEADRESERQSFASVDDYLRSLEMVATIVDAPAAHVARLAQLAQRTNQFNTTTIRYGEEELHRLRADPDRDVLSVGLRDRFGDYGIVSLVVVRFAGTDATIESWMMSCRAMSRGLEDQVLNVVLARAKDRGAARLIGIYVPTKKNRPVEDLFPRLGFRARSDGIGGTWELPLADAAPRPTHVAVA